MGEKAEEQPPRVGDDEGVVDEVLLTAPHDLHLATALLRASPHVHRSVLLSVNNSGRAEGFRVEFGAGFLLHADGLGVDVTTGTVYHEEEDGHLKQLSLLTCWAGRVAHRVGGDFGRDCRVNLLGGVKTVLGSQDAQEVEVGEPALLSK